MAVIAWGWESKNFYVKWMHDPDPRMAAQLKGPILNPGSPQSKQARDVLRLVEEVLLRDAVFTDRIKRHYALFRAKIESPRIQVLPRTRNRNLKKKRHGKSGSFR